MSGKQTLRIGQGIDVHQLVAGRKCILGGVDVPFDQGLMGHSDADVLTHAVIDALLGACGWGDIGQWFPDDDPRFDGANSLHLLRHVVQRLQEDGYVVVNVDTTIVAQAPKIAPYVEEMRQQLADALDMGKDAVSVKATTSEGLGFTGRKEGIMALAIALIRHEREAGCGDNGRL